MMLGVGTDLCDIRRIERTLLQYGERFITRIYTQKEQKHARAKSYPPATFAKFFAAKEAFSKALGTGFREGVYWRNIEVQNLPSGKPYLNISGGALLKLKSRLPQKSLQEVSISLTDEYPLAHAIVIISVRKIDK